MKIRAFLLGLVLITFGALHAQSVDPVVQAVIAETSIDSLIQTVDQLSGVIPAPIKGNLDTIRSRNANDSGNWKAAQYLRQRLANYGLAASLQTYSTSGTNVLGVQIGADYPDQHYIICAHFDDMPSGPTAPGADDNASGTAAVVEAARILSRHVTSSTIIYALWDEEEQGLVGSEYYAAKAKTDEDNIQGVLNLDMIAWDSNNDMKVEIHTKDVANAIQLTHTLLQVDSTYGIGLNPAVYNPGASASDHSSFWRNGYGALLMIEGYYSGDFNAYYHTKSDQVGHFNLTYFHSCAQLAVGTLASLAGLKGLAAVGGDVPIPAEIVLEQNYPNPFNPATTITFSIPHTSSVVLRVFNALGEEVTTLADGTYNAGSHAFRWDASTVASGVYFYRLQAGGGIQSKKMLLVR